jgi:predicted nuclease of predicted toxin-antitoxin system
MRLLFDQNISRTLGKKLADIYPDTTHVAFLNMLNASDIDIWQYCKLHNIGIVTKDTDFRALSARLGHPPKVILLQIGNCTTQTVETVLRSNENEINSFLNDDFRSIFII